ncbi:hypothetical protein H0H92_010990 [Tricholoma furcatifolium]|nr:hypothetical protein H0H92_010990 [Tricholoma furcatifolium]
MLFLSNISGSFPVAATTFATQVSSPRQFGNIKLASNSEPALLLQEVAFTAYYPADVSATARRGLDWVLRHIPIYPNAPLARPRRKLDGKDEEKRAQWPLIIFSHGLGGSRTAYRANASITAKYARGLRHLAELFLPWSTAMELDVRVYHECAQRAADIKEGLSTTTKNTTLYFRSIPAGNSSKEATPLPLRTDQLEFRRAEIYTAYQSFVHFLKNDCASELYTIDNQPIDQTSWAYVDPVSNEGPICFDKNVVLAGHSFGGCTVLSILSSNPSPEYMHIPVSHALILDPWLEPLPVPGPATISQSPAEFVAQSTPLEERRTPPLDQIQLREPKRDSRLPRMLVINSETFTLWKDHYERLKAIVNAWEPEGRRLLTLVGSKHQAFSDFPLLPFIRSAAAGTIMDLFSRLSIAFLDNQLDEALDCTSIKDMDVQIIGKKKDGKPKRRLGGSVGDVVVT